jgi:hypothetical protein
MSRIEASRVCLPSRGSGHGWLLATPWPSGPSVKRQNQPGAALEPQHLLDAMNKQTMRPVWLTTYDAARTHRRLRHRLAISDVVPIRTTAPKVSISPSASSANASKKRMHLPWKP